MSNNEVLKPVIVSASRSTDIPAFYADWFLERLRNGFCTWINPFNQMRHRISFEDTRMIVFWSKNPRPMLHQLDEFEKLGFKNYYFQFTLNDYMAERLEPNVPDVTQRIDTFKRLVDRLGKERVIWRYDPLLLSSSINIENLLHRINRIGEELNGYTEKLVFSFADIVAYRKVSKNLNGTSCRELLTHEKLQLIRGLVELNSQWNFELATCAEDIELNQFGIKHNKCIDDDLMMRLFNHDSKLMNFIGAEYDMLEGWRIKKSKKDKGQRKGCGCIQSKDIGMYNTCPHLCRYCYANTTDITVMKNWNKHLLNSRSDLLVND